MKQKYKTEFPWFRNYVIYLVGFHGALQNVDSSDVDVRVEEVGPPLRVRVKAGQHVGPRTVLPPLDRLRVYLDGWKLLEVGQGPRLSAPYVPLHRYQLHFGHLADANLSVTDDTNLSVTDDTTSV